MATFPLVNIQDSLGPLVRLSLVHHDIPVHGVFEVIEESSGEQFVAIATPVADEKGDRDALLRIFTALNGESFSTFYLRLHVLVLSLTELREIRRVLKKGTTEAYLPKLGHLGEVTVRPTEDPGQMFRPGTFRFSVSGNSVVQMIFAPMDGRSKPKGRNFANLEQAKEFLRVLKIAIPAELSALTRSGSVSMVVTPSLEDLYSQGLI
jgi:hypothetical protein